MGTSRESPMGSSMRVSWAVRYIPNTSSAGSPMGHTSTMGRRVLWEAPYIPWQVPWADDNYPRKARLPRTFHGKSRMCHGYHSSARWRMHHQARLRWRSLVPLLTRPTQAQTTIIPYLWWCWLVLVLAVHIVVPPAAHTTFFFSKSH